MHRATVVSPIMSSSVSTNPLYKDMIEFTPSSLSLPLTSSSPSPGNSPPAASIPSTPAARPSTLVSPPSSTPVTQIPSSNNNPGEVQEELEEDPESPQMYGSPQLIWRNSTPLPELMSSIPYESSDRHQRHATLPDVRPKKITFSDLRRQAGLNWSKTSGSYVNAQVQGFPEEGEEQEWNDSPLDPSGAKKNTVSVSIEKELNSQSRYKTELCRSFQETGQCRYGLKCQFAHGHDELRPVLRHPKYKTEICKTFSLQGTCPYGNRCRFIHKHAKSEIGSNSIFIPPRAGNPALPSLWKDVVQKKSGKYISSQVQPPPGVGLEFDENQQQDLDVEAAVDEDPPSDELGSEIRLRPSPRAASREPPLPPVRTDIKTSPRTSAPPAESDGTIWSQAKTYADPWKSAPSGSPQRKETSVAPPPVSKVAPPVGLEEEDPNVKASGETRRRGSSGSRLPIFQQLTGEELIDEYGEIIPDDNNLAGSVKESGQYLNQSH